MLSITKLARVAISTARLFQDPSRLEDAIEIADLLASPEVRRGIAEVARRTPHGARALRERPRVRIDLEALSRLPAGTLGRALADFVREHDLDLSALPRLAARSEHEYVQAHLFETHDILHVVLGFGVDVAGELGVMACLMAQIPSWLAPTLIAGGLLQVMSSHEDQARRMDAITRGWQAGRRARLLFGTNWNELWATPLPEVRARLGLEASAPRAPRLESAPFLKAA
jgi:ubiquinone biosynthesis protein COQ4